MDSHESLEKRCQLPYAVEYAKSGRAACKACRELISEGSMRISALEPSRFFDGLQDNWHHSNRINESSIKGMDLLRWEDQEIVRGKLEAFNSSKSKPEISRTSPVPNNFTQLEADYSATNRGKCDICKDFFHKDELKLKRKSKWNHAVCVFTNGCTYEGEVSNIVGFDALKEAEKDLLLLLEQQQKVPQPVAKPESKDEAESMNSAGNGNPTAADVSGDCVVVDDGLSTAGTSAKMEKKASHVKLEQPEAKRPRNENDPADEEKNRRKEKLKGQSDVMWELRKALENVSKNDLIDMLKSNNIEVPKESTKIVERVVDFGTFGKPAPCPKCLGQLVYSCSHKTYVCLGYVSEFTKCTHIDKNPTRSPFAIPRNIVIKYEFLRTAPFNKYLSERIYSLEDQAVIVKGAQSAFKKYGFQQEGRSAFEIFEGDYKTVQLGMATQVVKKGTVVDSEFSDPTSYHVFRDETGIYSAAMSMTDAADNRNSYYKLQLLKHDSYDYKYVLFRSWGRVGTAVGGTCEDQFSNEASAIQKFHFHFHEKTGNQWQNRKYFRKFAGKMNFVENDYKEFEEDVEVVAPGSKTTLPSGVKTVLMAIFDVRNMKAAMQSFELDLEKMPLGKLSKEQIMKAFNVLSELQNALLAEKPSREKIIDITNKFYTYIPHNFGMREPILLDNVGILKQKTEMLDALLEIQYAYETVKNDKKKIPATLDPVDAHYKELRCDMEPLPHDTAEFAVLKKYLKNSVGSTHVVKYELLDILKLKRHGEEEKFQWQLGNRMLLWHGSLKMNYVGILSQGLRIAPPEAPVTGYMFGKGVYFADMFTKSSFYCRTNPGEEGYMLLCEVALGTCKEELHSVGHSANSIKGFGSVKGVGRESPNRLDDHAHPDGYVIPLGKAKIDTALNSALLYNEYIVYNTNQIKMRYLVRLRFNESRHK
ncbi:unnamed protein product [Caenorhabditis auriculariae]|uniref:Poly [ADP-ribose] polymerase n=1 Tax=Caenorhabditis auriculariae TaxID=2777116 RepID=A0A8S1HP66_9PELO|nr:unnamed protein product [Caenorhabditis auriculariae]